MSTTPTDSRLPDGWALVTLGEIVRPSSERIDPWEEQEAPYLSLEHVESHTNRIVGRGTGADVRSLKSVFRANDVLYGKLRPYLNKVAVPDFDGICSTDFIVFRPNGYLDPYFLAYFLTRREVYEYANHHASGTQLPRIGLEELGTLQVPLPPRAEQERIAAELRQVFAEIDGISKRIARAADAVSRLQDAIVSFGAAGMLTAEWRDKNEGCVSAATLLNEVAASREVDAPAKHSPEGLPDGWSKVLLGFLAEPTDRGQPFVTSGSRGWAHLVGDVGEHFIRSENINTDRLRLDDSVRVNLPEGVESERTRVRGGDLLLTITGNNVGRAAVVPDDCPAAHVSQHVAIVRIDSRFDADYIWLWLRSSQHGQKQLREVQYGGTKPGLNLEQVRSIVVDLPPREEQEEIVARVRELTHEAEAIATRVRRAEAMTMALRQSVLTKAFSGKLLLTEANLAIQTGRSYENASQLIERVRAEEAATPAEPVVKRRTGRMNKLSREAVEAVIETMPAEGFSFDELSKKLPSNYEALKAVLFDLLDDKASGLTQVFDRKARAIRFQRTAS